MPGMENAVVAGLFREYQGLDGLRLFAVAALPLLFGITVHEVAHGWVAKLRGDRTAEMLGRLTLNPIKHIDPIGTVLVPGVMLLTTGFIFGWAKPVPVTVENLKRRNKDMAIVDGRDLAWRRSQLRTVLASERFISSVKTRQNLSNLPGSKNRFCIARSTRASNS